MKKLFILALSVSAASLVSASEEFERGTSWDPDAIAKQKEERASLQRRDSYQNLERLRDGLGRHDRRLRKVEHRQYEGRDPFHSEKRETEDGEEEFFRHNVSMRDIQKPGDASLAHIAAEERLLNGERRTMLKEAKRENVERGKLRRRNSFKMLEDLRRDRGDFEVDEFGQDRMGPDGKKFVRMNDVEKAGDSSRLLKEELRLADKYITHLRSENEKLKTENDKLKTENDKLSGRLHKTRKKLKEAKANAYSPNSEDGRSSSVRTQPTRFSEDDRRSDTRFNDERETGLHLPDIGAKRNDGELDRGFKLMQRASERGKEMRRFDPAAPTEERRSFDRSSMRDRKKADPFDDRREEDNNTPEGGDREAPRGFGR